jgi:hypothetical protein
VEVFFRVAELSLQIAFALWPKKMTINKNLPTLKKLRPQNIASDY